jgi:hypothetical protein
MFLFIIVKKEQEIFENIIIVIFKNIFLLGNISK